MENILDISVFESGSNCVSLGKIKPEIVAFLTQKVPQLSGQLNADTDILFLERQTQTYRIA